MQGRTKALISFIVLIVLLGGTYLFTDWFSKTVGYVLGENENIKLAKCLDEKGVIFYFSDNCPDCQKQIELFGDEAFRYLNGVVNCDLGTSRTCDTLAGVPAWKIADKFYYGVRQFNELGKISKCDR